MRSYEATGRTVEEALSSGLEHLGVVISDVTYSVLDGGSKGLFGFFGSKPARVRIEVKDEDDSKNELLSSLSENLGEPEKRPQPKPAAEKPQPKPNTDRPQSKPAADRPQSKPDTDKTQSKPNADKPQPKPNADKPRPKPGKTDEKAPADSKPARKPDEPRPPRKSGSGAGAKPEQPKKPAEPPKPAAPADPATQAGKAQVYLQDITRLMNVPVSVAVQTDDEGNVLVNLEGDTLGVLIGRRGETLDALQYLTSLHVNKGQEGYTRVTLDTENYRAKREEALIRLANRMASRAQKTGRKVALEPMNPYERRILHSALQNHEAVTTHSEGEDPNRHVVITLKKQA